MTRLRGGAVSNRFLKHNRRPASFPLAPGRSNAPCRTCYRTSAETFRAAAESGPRLPNTAVHHRLTNGNNPPSRSVWWDSARCLLMSCLASPNLAKCPRAPLKHGSTTLAAHFIPADEVPTCAIQHGSPTLGAYFIPAVLPPATAGAMAVGDTAAVPCWTCS